MSRLPLDLFGEITTPSGTRYKWDANQGPADRPLGFSFGTKIGEGFSNGSLTLRRRIDQDYPDLGLVNDIRFVGADGSIAYEGRLSAMPRELDDSHSIGVTLGGWMAHASDRKFRQTYVGRQLGRWGEPTIGRKTSLMVTSSVSMGDFSWATDNGGLVCALPNQALGTRTIAEAVYRMPSGTYAGTVQYKGTTTSIPSGWIVRFFASDNEDMSSMDTYTPTLDDTLRTLTLTTPRKFVGLYVYSNDNASTPAAGANVRFDKLAVGGDHGLTFYTGESGEPAGVYASDVIRHIAANWCPRLDTSGVQNTDYVIQQLDFDARTKPFDAFLEVNKYHLWHLGVWDNKQLVYRPYDLSDYDWEIRTDDQGTAFSPQGPSITDLANGIDVTYTDLLTGAETDLLASDYSELRDGSPTNPWSQWGIAHYDEIALTSPSISLQALNIGQAALGERNSPKTPGTITVRGYIRDRQGNPQPVWKVRAGQTISVTNFPNDSPRLIVETDYSDDDKTVRLAIDKPFALLDAYIDRQQNALAARGLA